MVRWQSAQVLSDLVSSTITISDWVQYGVTTTKQLRFKGGGWMVSITEPVNRCIEIEGSGVELRFGFLTCDVSRSCAGMSESDLRVCVCVLRMLLDLNGQSG